jgi:ATP-dependent exoDNAse (exonuclease V) beta subunit
MIINENEKSDRESIIKHLDKSMSVEAGAGAGKTTLIVSRVIEQLKSGKLKAQEIVIITFTNAAAEELRGRILNELHKAADKQENTEEERKNLRAAVDNESLIQISTIHSFCKRLLTEQSFAAHLPMDVKLLDNVETRNKKIKFFNEWYRQQDTKELQKLEAEFYRGKSGEYLLETFVNICELPENTIFRYDSSLLNNKKLDEYVADMKKQLEDIFNYIIGILRHHYTKKTFSTYDEVIAHADKSGKTAKTLTVKAYNESYMLLHPKNNNRLSIKKLVEVYKACWEYKSDASDDTKGEKVRTLKKCIIGTGSKKLDLTRNLAQEMNEEFAALVDDFSYLADELEAYQSTLIIDMALKARADYIDYCKKPENRHELTNDALLVEALNLVKNNRSAREYFRHKFSCIYVDEFQDTDMVQRDLLEWLCEESDSEDASEQESRPNSIRPGSLFFVGDPKQSIYAFRGADVDVYESTRKKYEADDITEVEVYSLSDNYRSEKSIVDWVNKNFEARFDGILTNGYIDMNGVNNNPDTDVLQGIYTLDYPAWVSKGTRVADKDKPSSQDIYDTRHLDLNKLKDAGMVTAIIKHLTDDGIQIWEKTGNTYVKRNILYKDFLILCNRKSDINLYADVLKRAGIPVNLYGALDVENEDVLLRVSQLYHFLAFPGDKKARYGAMEVLLGQRITQDNILEGDKRIDSLYNRTKRFSGYELLQFLMHHLEYVVDENCIGEQMCRTRSRLQQLLEKLMSNPLGDRKFIDNMISDYMESDVDKDLAMERDANAVMFMNLHKAKGLEGKIVIIAARTKRTSKPEAYRNMEEYYPLAENSPGAFQTKLRSYLTLTDSNGDKISSLVENKERAEWTRQDYVEVTRGKEAVIFMDALAPGCVFDDFDFETGTKKLKDISIDLKNDLEKAEEGSYNVAVTGQSVVEYDMDEWSKSDTEEQSYHQYRSITPSGMELHDSLSWKPGEDAVRRPAGNIFGTVMHRAFELLVNRIRVENAGGAEDTANVSNEINISDITQIVNRAIMEHYEDIVISCDDPEAKDEELKLYQEYLVNRLSAFLRDERIVNMVVSGVEVYTEMDFSQYASQTDIGAVDTGLYDILQSRYSLSSDEPYWINGAADLVIVDENRHVKIIDYKSDHRGTKTNEELEEHLQHTYNNQQELYRFTVSKVLGIPIEDITYEYYHLYRDIN